jgi:gamma-glutamyltranspeptidase/glutathione hydrolase
MCQNPVIAQPDGDPVEIGTYDRTYGPRHQSRSVVYATSGMACTSDPRATQAAIEILQRGGNAIDAAIAANAMLGLVEPMSCGIGGDLFAIVWDAKSGKMHGLNASGRSPKLLTREEFDRRKLSEIPIKGELSWSVPGCVQGWEDLSVRFGQLPLRDCLAGAISAADRGFPVSEIIAGYWKASERELDKTPEARSTYLMAGAEGLAKAPRAGDLFRNPRLARVYDRIANEGAKVFYRGDIADQIVAYSQKQGGFFSKQDFAQHRNDWVDPVSTDYRGYRVWELPPNGQGIAALQMLNVLERFDLRKMGFGSADSLHLLTEAKKLAFADRARFYADMDFARVPVQELISKEYAARQARRIRMDRAAVDVPAGDPKLAQGDTIYLCVVDRDRNCCSLIQSNFHGFGSALVPGQLGFVLQNRGALFHLDPAHPNVYQPGKRPFHTIIPAMMTKSDKPCFVFGVMGGDMQPQGHVQVVVNIVDFQMNIQMAGDAARVRHDGSASPTGTAMQSGGGVLLFEYGIPRETRVELERRGHRLNHDQSGMGGYQGIWIDWERGVLMGATESRKDGVAIGIDD